MAAGDGHPRREDYKYERCGTANLFLWYEPLQSRRHVTATARRTGSDWAACIKDLVDVQYPDAERVVLVLDNLNTHTPASLYTAFDPAQAKRITDRLEIHYTPKHGSWLNMAEIELSILRVNASLDASPTVTRSPEKRQPEKSGALLSRM